MDQNFTKFGITRGLADTLPSNPSGGVGTMWSWKLVLAEADGMCIDAVGKLGERDSLTRPPQNCTKFPIKLLKIIIETVKTV